jgi:hypothetical protein
MTNLRIKMTLRWMLALIALFSAYLAGLVSNRPALNDAWSELDSAEKELALERERLETAELIAQLPLCDSRNLDRVDKLLDRLSAYEEAHSQSVSGARKTRVPPKASSADE